MSQRVTPLLLRLIVATLNRFLGKATLTDIDINLPHNIFFEKLEKYDKQTYRRKDGEVGLFNINESKLQTRLTYNFYFIKSPNITIPKFHYAPKMSQSPNNPASIDHLQQTTTNDF